MAHRTREYLTRLIAAAALTGVMGLSSAASVSADPKNFKQLEGSWRGGGTVMPAKGGRERISCRVKYGVLGNNISQNINCAGADYKINVNGKLVVSGNKISGSWIETNNNYSGGASGSVKGNTISVRISGVSFTGTMAISFSGRNQNVRITRYDPQSKKYMNLANISLRQ